LLCGEAHVLDVFLLAIPGIKTDQNFQFIALKMGDDSGYIPPKKPWKNGEKVDKPMDLGHNMPASTLRDSTRPNSRSRCRTKRTWSARKLGWKIHLKTKPVVKCLCGKWKNSTCNQLRLLFPICGKSKNSCSKHFQTTNQMMTAATPTTILLLIIIIISIIINHY
jgi:hypothetical protein